MEVSILRHSEVSNENVTFRIDAEYFRKAYRDAVSLVENGQFSYVEMVTSWVTQGPNPKFSEYGMPCLTGRNINKGEVSYHNPDFVDDSEFKKLSRFTLKAGDTLITLKGKGSIGKIGFVTQDHPAIFSRDIGIVRPSSINPGYLNIFILCKYGKLIIDRGETGGTGQSTLTTSYLKTMPVPRFSIEEDVGDFLDQVELLRSKSQKVFCDAERILLTELGLLEWKSKHRLSFVKNYSELEQAERMDAEYFQPKYDEIEETIKSYHGGFSLIKDEFEQNKDAFEVDDEKTYQYVEIGSVNVATGEVTESTVLGAALPANAKRSLKKNDVIVSKVRTYRGAITIIEKDGFVGSGAFTVLRENGRINKETLMLFLHSKPLLAWSLKPNTGTSYPVIIDDDILNLPIPILPKEQQFEIQQKVAESFNLRKQSKHLLECAKKAVEIAIEQDEEAAIQWLETEKNRT